MNAQIDPIAVSMTEAARLLGVSRPTVYALAKTEGFPVVKLGGCTRVPSMISKRGCGNRSNNTDDLH